MDIDYRLYRFIVKIKVNWNVDYKRLPPNFQNEGSLSDIYRDKNICHQPFAFLLPSVNVLQMNLYEVGDSIWFTCPNTISFLCLFVFFFWKYILYPSHFVISDLFSFLVQFTVIRLRYKINKSNEFLFFFKLFMYTEKKIF